jgi:hypothetical protein
MYINDSVILSFVTEHFLQSDFNAESTRTCNICRIEVKISFGGEANWNSHLKSQAHCEKSKIGKSNANEPQPLKITKQPSSTLLTITNPDEGGQTSRLQK